MTPADLRQLYADAVAHYRAERSLLIHAEQGIGDTIQFARYVPLAAPELGDFAETAALVAALDGVVSVDTAAAHLAGALGMSGRVLLGFAPDWRWRLGREDSEWYPSLRLSRQEKPGDWETIRQKGEEAWV